LQSLFAPFTFGCSAKEMKQNTGTELPLCCWLNKTGHMTIRADAALFTCSLMLVQ